VIRCHETCGWIGINFCLPCLSGHLNLHLATRDIGMLCQLLIRLNADSNIVRDARIMISVQDQPSPMHFSGYRSMWTTHIRIGIGLLSATFVNHS